MKNGLILKTILPLLSSFSIFATEYKVAYLGGMTGPAASVNQYMVRAAKDYVKYAEISDLLGDHDKIVLDVRDTQYKPDEAKKIFEGLRDDKSILMMVGLGTGETLAIKKDVEDAKIALLCGSMAREVSDSGYVFRLMSSYEQQIMAILDYIIAKTPKDKKARIAFYVHPSSFGQKPVEFVRAEIAARKLNVEIVGDNIVHNEQTNYATTLEVLKKNKVEFVITHTLAVNSANLIKEASQLGLVATKFGESGKITFMGSHYAGGMDLIKLAGKSANGFYWATSLQSPHGDTAGNLSLKDMAKKIGADPMITVSSDYHTAILQMQISVEAVKRAKEMAKKQHTSVDRATVLAGLESMHGAEKLDLKAFSPVEFTPQDHVGLHLINMHLLKDEQFVKAD